ncbi:MULTISPECIES: undecaprenyldiphospho-muramoylpentapeptide beta-N-acetylglucosaminyltransferase [unclassified Pseudovibrio]|uniref:undecaprenyldiphospho-muramoylpentapeptide beta-N-acetylglucosaminyltransferase n=1 Tax=unclassified Pseudovibrio TaxID=2627060 RepID=UPI0007AE68D9|nr:MULTISPECIES: undecaprenyldiphospho-muramoylpentapeptide beta-N-acetylglucosaminyltransferase [unclassified Pseudovibrio]KZK94746.1 UDP-N-acetylglucosamine--N-acetylmuramyl-(pentapeptide) pyrophosphoryl-undecaprenol N-acetylglucosamine transferase [Pseudovibrio sp. W74]KZL04695.1 UDP-N-acetylglucosamine--N-acetylmuramyl-(pentapeptide) pyrophosphoryl-undecaprenol N-acetylglucosamine transferase [Pseudovibrio sp. Ad14]
MKPKIMLTAGGTGGHLFPAQALACELKRRGYGVELITDSRADKYGSAFPADNVHLVKSDTIRGKNPISLAKTAIKLGLGTLQAMKAIRAAKPAAIVGFGGYPTFPPMFAGRLLSVPSILHEANAVMGRANRMLAKGATAVATSFPLKTLPADLAAKATMTGNPLRDNVIAVCGQTYNAPEKGGAFHLLVFGGSQGARVFSQILPAALKLMAPEDREQLVVVQQARPEDLEGLESSYREMGVAAQVASFFTDLPERIAAAHLVISRSGAGTVCELAAIGRPSILVPLPGALDNDQGMNANVLAEAGGAWPIPQKELDPQRLARELKELMDNPGRLAQAAHAAQAQGAPEAVQRLADLTETLVGAAPATEQKEIAS